MYGENTKYHVNPYIQGTTVPCDTCVIVLRLSLLLQMYRDRKGSKSVEVWMASTLEQQTMVYICTFSFLFVMM